MSPFEYIVGIHTIVLGLATAHLLSTIADTIKYRDTVSHYWLHSLWCVLLQFLLIGWWYGLWRVLRNEPEISYSQFLLYFAFTVSLYLAVRFLAVNIESERNIDLKTYFFRVRVPFFVFLGIPYLLVLASGQVSTGNTGTPIGDVVTAVAQLLVPIIGILASNERIQKVLVFAYGLPYLTIELQQLGVGLVQ